MKSRSAGEVALAFCRRCNLRMSRARPKATPDLTLLSEARQTPLAFGFSSACRSIRALAAILTYS